MNQLQRPGNGRWVTTVIIGAGHAGLAISQCLQERSIGHVLLERGEVANSWRHERWDSLRLLTPNWQNRLPNYTYRGHDPDGFLAMPEVTEFICNYASAISAPVETHTRVTGVYPLEAGYRVETSRGEWYCRTLVIASGAFNLPLVPELDNHLPAGLLSVTPHEYRNPGQLTDGGVLVVGASATGLQIADEIQRSGRPVTLSVGEHVRMPRRYRGRDILFWLDVTGILDEGYREVDDISRARRLPSAQLVGSTTQADLDLNALADRGVRLVGRLAGIRGRHAQCSGSLANLTRLADLKMGRLLRGIDAWIEQQGWSGEVDPPERPVPTRIDPAPPLELDLTSGEYNTVIWATGFRPDYSWLKLPVLDRRGRLRHDGGVVDAPGVYVTGLPFLRRRKSSFIYGAEADARELSDHLVAYLSHNQRQAAG